MQLSPKAVRFVIEALEHYRKHLDQRLQQEGLSEDDIADLINDQHYLAAIQQEFENYQDELVRQGASAQADR